MVRRGDADTLTDDVYVQVRSKILAGHFAPGERLIPTALCAEYAVKPGVLREALTRLVAEQLATSEPNRGIRVVDVTRQQIEDLADLRRINEGAALRLAMARQDPDREAAAIAALHRLASPGSPPTAHHDFHLALLAGCGNDRLLQLCEDLFEAAELYRRWSVAALSSPTTRTTRHQHDEHRAILEAVLSGDADRAVHLHEQHLQRTVDLALAFVARREVSPSRM